MSRKQSRKSNKRRVAKRGDKTQTVAASGPTFAVAPFVNPGVSSLLLKNVGALRTQDPPGGIDSLFIMAKNHHQAGRLDQAEQIYRQILQRNKRHAACLHLLGLIMHQRGKSSEALALIKSSIEEKPKDAESQNNMGNVLRRLGRAHEAIAHFENAVELAPKFAGAYSNLGLTHRQLGQFPEAAAQFRNAINHDPYLAEAWAGLAKVGRLSLNEEEVGSAENVLQNKRLSDNDRRHICFALGKHFDAVQEWSKAFQYYDRANSLSEAPSTKGDSSRLLTAILDHSFLPLTCTPEIDSHTQSGVVPIFIFGMPRSGTTLVEQILASHPDVSSGGELNVVEHELKRMFPALGRKGLGGLESMTPSQSSDLKEAFMDTIASSTDANCGKSFFYTDKSLLNFAFLPSILSAFPDARLVHCRRNPIDTCLSIYFTDFKAAYEYTSDLGEIGQIYCLYYQVMEKWNAALPGRVFDIHYEDILDDQEDATRQLLDYCGLTWNAACMNFFETDRQVSTPSDWQVRLPIFSSSRDRWKHYDKHLGSLIRSLESCI
ncbi:MAG: tetratricopeptide repeat protein [Rhodospirillales bacterium]|nr:tetratricopeptide repeat protein [Rhodospirillales bacterium]MBT4039934.1 tetratricopeptide repeat protein [Rhodospirillales bacterium]MBT5351311.1 tetratricopeptide repeat protein [Rhodospirillales bacterium]MBT5521947.1 tetratricopeptide repeat protein [Rhodospirillales bacterium]MBT6110945.1 tetratricopeptide repeat protein [Rhodospirillales bacterium]